MCPDCLYLSQQMEKLKKDFAGKINVAIQFFPLDACNSVVPEKGIQSLGRYDLWSHGNPKAHEDPSVPLNVTIASWNMGVEKKEGK